MLSFNSLGNHGHLGNQMFQYASLRGIASNNNLDFCIPPKEFFGTMYPLRSSIYECFKLTGLKNMQLQPNNILIAEPQYEFCSKLFAKCIDDIDLNGYFQSPKYFTHIELMIREDFEFNDSIKNAGNKVINSIGEEFASLHIRRTDYLNISAVLNNLDAEYYTKALNMIPKDIKVIVFSDDISWCKEQEIFQGDRFIFSDNSAYIDMYIMTKAKFNIIANSTFSWWGAWLNSDSTVICPKRWFSESFNATAIDLIPEEWTQV